MASKRRDLLMEVGQAAAAEAARADAQLPMPAAEPESPPVPEAADPAPANPPGMVDVCGILVPALDPSEPLVPLNCDVPESLRTALKTYCAMNRTTVRDFMAEAIRRELARRQGGGA